MRGALLLASILGCGGSIATMDASIDASTDSMSDSIAPDSAIADAATDTRVFGPCDELPLGAYVTQTSMAGMAPAPVGGSIADGLYMLTAAQLYGMGMSVTFAQSVLIQNGTMQFTKLIKGDTKNENLFATYMQQGPTSVALTFAPCTGGDAGAVTQAYDYSATPTIFTLQGTRQNTTIVIQFAKQ